MEVQLAVKSTRTTNGPPRHVGDATSKAVVPNYLKPSIGSCHHACKYGGTHTFEERADAQPKTRKQTPVSDSKKRTPLIRPRLVPRKLLSRGDHKVEEAAAAVKEEEKKKADLESEVEWKDIVAYVDTVSSHGSSIIPEHPLVDDGAKTKKESPEKKLVKPPVGSKMMAGDKASTTEPTTTRKNMNTDTNKGGVKPPRGKKQPTVLVVAKKKAVVDQELVDGYQPLSPSLLQNRASLLRDLEAEKVVHEATTNANESKTAHNSLDQEEYAAAEASRPIPAHRRVKSMSISSRSVRFPFAQQASRNSATFKLRSKSSKAGPIILPSEGEEKKPARIRSRRGSMRGGDDVGSTGTGRGIQLRIRSLRRRGVGGGSSGVAASTGFVVPAVPLRHQKTLEKKRSQRLYNNMIEETASKLVKTRKSRVKALVGAFESVISKIAK